MSKRLKIAAIVTEYRKFAHGQHIVDRFLEGYGWNSRHHRPEMDVVSLYVDQFPEGDLSRDRVTRFPGMKLYPTIADALTLGGDDLAVDGVLLIAEHGSYPANEKGQRLWPRYEMYKQIVAVYRTTGKVAPIFNDKHLSWKWEWAKEMVDTANEMGFGLMAGSSLPVAWRIPAVELPQGAVPTEALCVAYGGVDSYDYHALETTQGMVEWRPGGEKGVKWVQAYKGDSFWEAHHAGVWSRDLFEAALSRSHTLTPARPGFNDIFPTLDEMKAMVKEPIAYVYEHVDGLKCSMILVNGLVKDFNFAARLQGREKPFSVHMYLAMPPAYTTLASFFSPLVNNVEELFLTGKSPYPVERTLLTGGIVEAGVDSLFQGQVRVETPHLAQVTYPAPTRSTFWRS
jgi:hypothetical protein